MKIYKDSNNLFHLGIEIYPAGTCYLIDNPDGNITIRFLLNRVMKNYLGGDIYNGNITGITNESGTAYTSVSDLLTDVGDFFLNASSSVGGGYLGTISYASSAPTPGKSGYYFFSDAGTVSYLSQIVKIGDKLSVVYSGGSYTYTLISIIDSLIDGGSATSTY
jgi:hypothetical protein